MIEHHELYGVNDLEALMDALFDPASCDSRRMAETENTGSVRSTGGAVPSEAQADAQTSPKEYP